MKPCLISAQRSSVAVRGGVGGRLHQHQRSAYILFTFSFIPTHFLMLGMGLQGLMYAKQTLNHRAIPLA